MEMDNTVSYTIVVVCVQLKRETMKQREAVSERLPANEKAPLFELSVFLS